MRELVLQAEVRSVHGKRSRAVRRLGKVPGVFYVHGEPNIPISVEEKSLKPLIFTTETHIINLKLNEGGDKSCILRDLQFDPVTDRPIHFDLQGLRADEKINIEVPIIMSGGTPSGVRDGGILQHILHRLKISCLPKDIPEHVEVNVSELKINQFVHVRDLQLANVTILDNEASTILGVIPPTVEKAEVASTTTEAVAAEPEVITKGKKPEDEAGGEKKPEAGAAKPAPAKEAKK